MILIENTEVSGFEAAVRGMRNPMNSWEKSDSRQSDYTDDGKGGFVIGKNDLALMKKLVHAGTDHAKFMRMITVTCDITAPMYFNKELDTYKVGTVRNSCSTMHKITAKEFEITDFSHEHMMDDTYNVMQEQVIELLNAAREFYLKTKDKKYWWQIIQLLPSSYNQRYTWQANYAVLRNIYHARKSHKLDEWKEFCKWVESLPYSELITDLTGKV